MKLWFYRFRIWDKEFTFNFRVRVALALHFLASKIDPTIRTNEVSDKRNRFYGDRSVWR